jgi:hypothetical protein
LNGKVTSEVVPERGLRQGDPISPYLFLICGEAFSSLLNSAEQEGNLEGIKVCEDALSFNHLLFVDDLLILLKVTDESAQDLQHVLELYEVCSGQTINVEKSSIMFSKNTRNQAKRAMMHRLGLTMEGRNEKYLGLPVYVGKSKMKVFEYLKDRVWKNIQGWKEKFLSKAGKEVLIKACAQAIPMFAMACFDITKGLCDQISSMICRYWWSHMQNENKMHWLSWDTMTLPKSEGGLGYKDLHSFNIAMLAKQGWRLLTDPKLLCARVLKAKYYPDVSVLKAQPSRGMSYTWRSIIKRIELLREGVIRRVGDGVTIDCWNDPWIPWKWNRQSITRRASVVVSMVHELINPIIGAWDESMINDIFCQLMHDKSLLCHYGRVWKIFGHGSMNQKVFSLLKVLTNCIVSYCGSVVLIIMVRRQQINACLIGTLYGTAHAHRIYKKSLENGAQLLTGELEY